MRSLCILLLLAACSAPSVPWGVDPATLPEVVALRDLPDLKPGSADEIHLFRSKDLSGKDLSQLSRDTLANWTFDVRTRWPEADRMPREATPAGWLEQAKDPGLGVRALHEQGIDGRGVVVALIDKPLRPTHREWEGRLHYHEVFEGDQGLSPHFHGAACTSFLAGKTTGVAPGATIHYFATPDQGRNAYFYAKALHRIWELNDSLPPQERIRVVSISDGVPFDNPDYGAFMEAVQRVRDEGIPVLYSGARDLGGTTWGGARPYADRQDPASYHLTPLLGNQWLWNRKKFQDKLVLPGDSRTSADNLGDDSYTYWGRGGYSWAIPYMAGLFALGWQVVPDADGSRLLAAIWTTAAESADGSRVPDPAAYLEELRRQK